MSPATDPLGCNEAREAIHVSLDADLMDAGLQQRLEAHLAGCARCRELASELRAVQGGLRSLPELKLPDEVLQRVWQRTSRSRRTRPWYLAAAAAAVVLTVLGGLWLRNGSESTGPTEAELRRAAREARMVLRLTGQALRRTERVAFDDVLTDEVSRALRRMPIQWGERGGAERSGS
jgi:anti-sigma factor RsiW